jgi:hypothetical protein
MVLMPGHRKKFRVFSWEAIQRAITPRPSATAGRNVFTYSGEMSGLPYSDAPSILNRSYTITAEVEIPQGGGEGMLVTLGGRFGGYGLYLQDGRPWYTYNWVGLKEYAIAASTPVPAGKATIRFEFAYDGGGFGMGGTGTITVNGQKVAEGRIEHTNANMFSGDEGADVGMDRETPVTENYKEHDNQFTGKIDAVTVRLGAMKAEDQDGAQKAVKEASRRKVLSD